MRFGAVAVFNAALLLAFSCQPSVCDEGLQGFLIVSAPRDGKISYVKLPSNGDWSGITPKVLIHEGLHHPQGLAIDHKRKRLFIADPDVQKIFCYTLSINGDSLSTDGRQTIVSSKGESRWVAVDGLGNVFFSDEPQSEILKVPMSNFLRGDTVPKVVYSGASIGQVSRPGGVAVDNFHVYWTNKHFGMRAGTVVKAAEVPSDGLSELPVNVVAQNAPKSYGVCLAMENVFFTDSEKKIYGVKKNGGEVGEVSSGLSKPRGCVWDGDGTVYVADRGNGAVYAFAGNMHRITRADVSKAFRLRGCIWLGFSFGSETQGVRLLALIVGVRASVAARRAKLRWPVLAFKFLDRKSVV